LERITITTIRQGIAKQSVMKAGLLVQAPSVFGLAHDPRDDYRRAGELPKGSLGGVKNLGVKPGPNTHKTLLV